MPVTGPVRTRARRFKFQNEVSASVPALRSDGLIVDLERIAFARVEIIHDIVTRGDPQVLVSDVLYCVRGIKLERVRTTVTPQFVIPAVAVQSVVARSAVKFIMSRH